MEFKVITSDLEIESIEFKGNSLIINCKKPTDFKGNITVRRVDECQHEYKAMGVGNMWAECTKCGYKP